MSAIGNCPWCGGEPDFRFNGKYYIHCRAQLCAASGPFRHTKEEAIAAWNRLASPGQGEVRGRIRQKHDRYYLGPFRCGQIVPTMGGEWIMYTVNADPTSHPTEAAARAALETAVREAINADPP